MQHSHIMRSAVRSADDSGGALAASDPALETASDSATVSNPVADTSILTAPDKASPPQEADSNGTSPPADYSALAVPEGVPADAEGLAAFKALAAENGIAPDLAQKLVAFQAERTRAAVEQHAATIQKWAGEAQADREFGGADFARNAGIARDALKAFATPALVAVLDQSGLGNHPELIRAFYRVGKAMAEDGRIVSAAGTSRRTSLDALYPTMASKE